MVLASLDRASGWYGGHWLADNPHVAHPRDATGRHRGAASAAAGADLSGHCHRLVDAASDERRGASHARPGPARAGVARLAARLAAVPDGRICPRLDTADPCGDADRDLCSRPVGLHRNARPSAGTGSPAVTLSGDRREVHPGGGRPDCRRGIGACMANRHDGDVRHGHANDAHRARPARGVGDPGDRRPAVAGGSLCW